MSSDLLVSRTPAGTWAILRENGSPVELRFERADEALAAGRVVKARVSRVLPGIQSAFLDVGQERDAFLHVADLLLPEDAPVRPPPDAEAAEESDDAEADAGDEIVAIRRETRRSAPIEDRLSPGRELLVQVARESLGAKGARVTCFVTLPGRYLVYLPRVAYRGVSRRITDPTERTRLREIIGAIPEIAGGFIARTAGEGATEAAFRADAAELIERWRRIEDAASTAPAPSVVHADVDLLLRVLRDAPREGLESIVVENASDLERARAFLSPIEPVLAARVRVHMGAVPLLDAEGVSAEIDKALRPRVWLRSGGTIVIQQTEALVSIDVNTGKFVGKKTPEDTILKTNLEAAVEIARQLRLRDLGGIIVVDFIDMVRPDSRQRVLETLEAELRRDRARTKVLGIGDLGLLQLTRKRTRAGLEAALTVPCPCCAGGGRIKSPDTVVAEVVRELRRLASVFAGARFTIRVHPEVAPVLSLALQHEVDPPGECAIESSAESRPDRFDVLAG